MEDDSKNQPQLNKIFNLNFWLVNGDYLGFCTMVASQKNFEKKCLLVLMAVKVFKTVQLKYNFFRSNYNIS